ncbi:hypothetical protein [Niveispirillum irakense]|nr:hypothetical protein [Niveispirillum irakense]
MLETWLRDRVGPIVDAARANPTAALSGEQVLDHLKALHSR